MLTIRPAQMDGFEAAARQRFEDEMVDHSQSFAPAGRLLVSAEQHAAEPGYLGVVVLELVF